MTTNLSFIKTNQKNIPEIVEIDKNKDYIFWGDDNKIPYYLYNLSTKSSVMGAIIGAMTDYILGDEIVNNTTFETVNRKGETFEDIIRKCAMDYSLFDGFAIQVIRSKSLENVAEINWMDMRHIRVDKDETCVWYCDWAAKKKKQPIKYPIYVKGAKQPNSVYYFKGTNTRGVYPMPMYVGALTSIETQAEISNYHLNAILNNFNAGTIVNFNNGSNLGEDEIEEIENKIYDKFSGTDNANKILLSFNDDQEHGTTIERMADDNTDKKYDQLYNTTIDDIYAGFRCNPVLTGLNKTNSGFTGQEFDEAFKLYNKTVIQPMQKKLIDALEKLFGKNCIEIKPFTIKFDTPGENNDNNNQIKID